MVVKEPEKILHSDKLRDCICQRNGDGLRAVCQGQNREFKRFRGECVDLTDQNSLGEKWYCNVCRDTLEKGESAAINITPRMKLNNDPQDVSRDPFRDF